MENKSLVNQRLLSLDILRGFDLFMLVFFQPVLASLLSRIDLPFTQSIMYHFSHEEWVGFRAWDLIMPLFLFMAGIAMPFSFSKYTSGTDLKPVYRRILKRVILLFIFGMIVQGNLLKLDIHYLRLYSNTLQAIASGYLIASIVLLHFNRKGQYIAAVVLLLLYWIPVTFLGDFTPEGNFAYKVDKAVLGRFMDGVAWNTDGTWSFSPNYHYTWILSSLTFGVTVLMGAFAGQILKEGKDKIKIARTLLYVGIGCIVVALIWSLQMPIIKKIWTCSMTLYSGGICFILMALFYYVIDCKGYSKGVMWLRYYGMNSIAAYVLGSVINFRCIPNSILFGLEPYIGEFYPVLLTFCNYTILFLILRELFKRGVFLRV